MKKLVLLLLASATITAVHAQTHSWLVYGNAGYDRTTTDLNLGQATSTNWAINPGIGYQFNDHLTVGVQGGYNRMSTTTPAFWVYPYQYPYTYSSITSVNESWTAGAFFRYTQWLGNIFFLYGQVNMSYISTSNSGNQYDLYYNLPAGVYPQNIVTSGNGFQAQLFPAVGVNIYKGFALNFSFGGINYTSLSPESSFGGGNSDHFNITLGQQINVGVSKNFTCHHHYRHMHHTPGMELRRLDISDDDDDSLPPPSSMHHEKKHKENHKSKKEDSDDDDDE